MFNVRQIPMASGQVSYGTLPWFPLLPPQVARQYSATEGWSGRTKRVLDIIAVLALLVLCALPMLLIALAIKLDSPGPVLFRQYRVGRNGRMFELWKFRTMMEPVEATEAGTLRQIEQHDSRLTRVGAFLRRCSLDELPQFVQILRGDMSLVGPRPHAPGTCAGETPFEQVTPLYALRHQVRPGLTGLAQVRGLRGRTNNDEQLLRRLESDLEYIQRWSLLFDFGILARTVGTVLSMRNAY